MKQSRKHPRFCPYFHEWIETEQWDDYEDKACIQTNVTAVACSFDDKSLWPRTQKHDWRLNQFGHCETVRLILWDEVKPNDRIHCETEKHDNNDKRTILRN